jgi:cation diffusion facilitator CzcD-associated flavoprotein CzcO
VTDVKAVYGEIATVTPTGMTTVTGEHYDFDIIACATGFDVQFVPHFKIIGRHGRVIREDWKETPNCYASLAAPGYPNYFMINGPRGNWGQGCSLPSVSQLQDISWH